MKNILHNITHISFFIYLLHKRYIKRYKRKYLGWLQGETRKLHKIFEDKNLMESMHRKISHTMRNLAWCAKSPGCLKRFSHGVRNFAQPCKTACCWIFSSDFPPYIFDWLGKGLWSAPKLGFFMHLSFNWHCHGFHQLLPHCYLVSMIK